MDQNQWNDNFPQNNAQEPQSAYNFTPPPVRPESNGYAIASLILGVVSLVLCCCCPVSIVTSILAIVFAILSRQGQPMNGKALGGMICGIVSIAITVVSIVFTVAMYSETNAEDFMQFYEEFSSNEVPADFNNYHVAPPAVE